MGAVKPSEGELAVLRVLWDRGPSTVRQVHELLGEGRAYTTTLKTMQIMLDKGLLDREGQGRGHVYRATLAEDATRKALLDRFLESAFGGSAAKLVMQALGNRRTSPAERAEIKAYLEQLERQEAGHGSRTAD